jgi:hypothetical protein
VDGRVASPGQCLAPRLPLFRRLTSQHFPSSAVGPNDIRCQWTPFARARTRQLSSNHAFQVAIHDAGGSRRAGSEQQTSPPCKCTLQMQQIADAAQCTKMSNMSAPFQLPTPLQPWRAFALPDSMHVETADTRISLCSAVVKRALSEERRSPLPFSLDAICSEARTHPRRAWPSERGPALERPENKLVNRQLGRVEPRRFLALVLAWRAGLVVEFWTP